jgi:hypothetical protein
MAQYWVVVGGRQVGLPSSDEEEAKQLLRDHLAAEPSTEVYIEVYNGTNSMTKMSWDRAASKWVIAS